MIEKYVEDGCSAVLVSPGYGAGWSTWNVPELAYDKRVVEFYLANKDKELSKEYLEKSFKEMGYGYVFFGGYDQLSLCWLPEGTKYRIEEYDGSEKLVEESEYQWMIA